MPKVIAKKWNTSEVKWVFNFHFGLHDSNLPISPEGFRVGKWVSEWATNSTSDATPDTSVKKDVRKLSRD